MFANLDFGYLQHRKIRDHTEMPQAIFFLKQPNNNTWGSTVDDDGL